MKNRLYKQQGLSLIEMMIAMVISLTLIAGVGTVYFSSKRNYQTRDQLSMMDENARVALDTLRKHLEHAGYASAQKLPLGNYFYVLGDADPTPVACGSGYNIVKVGDLTSRPTQDALNQYGDSISIRFVGDDSLFTDAVNSSLDEGCRAGVAPSLEATLIYNAFQVDNDGKTKDSSGNLVPILYAVGSASTANKQPIVNGIENIQFMYGLDANADGTVDQYLNATGISAAGGWQRVISIRVAILVRSIDPVLEANTAQSYTLLDVNVTPNDRYQRSVYTTTIQLRNVVDG
jgi:prepilin-type N-terminal cleavage/methylation domain-containing protein